MNSIVLLVTHKQLLQLFIVTQIKKSRKSSMTKEMNRVSFLKICLMTTAQDLKFQILQIDGISQ